MLVFYKSQGARAQPQAGKSGLGELWCEDPAGGSGSPSGSCPGTCLAPASILPTATHTARLLPDKDKWDLAFPFVSLNAEDLSYPGFS